MKYTDSKENDSIMNYEAPMLEWEDERGHKLRSIFKDMSANATSYLVCAVFLLIAGVGILFILFADNENVTVEGSPVFGAIILGIFLLFGISMFIYRLTFAIS